MANEIRIPTLGEGVQGGDVVTVHVSAGDTVKAGQALFEMETGKATVEVPSPADGVIESITVKEGQKVKVGDVVGTLAGGGEKPAQAAKAPAKAEAKAEAAPVEAEAEVEEEAPAAGGAEVAIVVPNLGEGVGGGTVMTIHVKAGDSVKDGQSLFELETGKATVEVPASAAGVIAALTVKEGDKLSVGDKVGSLQASGGAPAPKKAAAKGAATAAPAAAKTDTPKVPVQQIPAQNPVVQRPDNSPIPASPSVRKFAREIGVEINQITGSGPRGRLSIDDVKAWSKRLHQQRAAAPAAGGPVAAARKVPLPDFALFGGVERQKMSTIRKMTVEHMSNCWSTIPHVTQFDDADITDLEALRKSFQGKAEKAGAKLTMTAMLIKILGSALKAMPNFNASLDLDKEEVVLKKYVNVGCAVDTPKGLVVPVIRGVDGKNMIQISKELGDMAASMRDGKISPALLQGGCITLSNLGGLGGKHFTPIVNGPEVAILGVGRASLQPVWVDGSFQPRLLMPLSLSYDHRLIDGADGTRFLRWIVEAIEQPLLISLEG